jgi:hypothetical protein
MMLLLLLLTAKQKSHLVVLTVNNHLMVRLLALITSLLEVFSPLEMLQQLLLQRMQEHLL